jgi:hypothetical protein
MENQQDSGKEEKLLNLKEVQRILNVSYSHLINNIVKNPDPQKKLQVINVGRGKRQEYRVTQQALNEYLSRQTSQQNTIAAAVSELQRVRNSVVISYLTTSENQINQEDALFFSDVLEDIKQKKNIVGKIPNIDLFINSFGGSLDAAYKITRLLWQYAENVNAIVPISAKSAATAICVGTKEITMSPISELGPVDPIIENPVTKDRIPARSIKVFLSYASDKTRLEADKIDPAIIEKLGNKLEPLLAGAYFNAINTSKEYLKILLSECMFPGKRTDQELDNIVESLTELHYSHAFVIDATEAKKIGLNVRLANKEEDQAIKKLLVFYNQFMNAQGLTKLVGNEFFQIHQNLRR